MSLIELAGRLKDQDVRIDAAHLQRIETGRIVRLTADTLEAILSVGLGALFRTRRDAPGRAGSVRLPVPMGVAHGAEDRGWSAALCPGASQRDLAVVPHGPRPARVGVESLRAPAVRASAG
jgi:DNA-binding Xre family transcriptional regulator